MLKMGKSRHEDDLAERGDIFRAVSHIVPCSGIQFIDIQIDRDTILAVGRKFSLEQVDVAGTKLWTLAPSRTVKPRHADTGHDEPPTLRIDGPTAIKSALGRWLPLPLLRFLARDGAGRLRFDEGPHNWARIYLTADTGADGDPDLGTVKGVVAIDTQVADDARFEIAKYAAPSVDDVRFGSTFALTDDAEPLAPFLAEEWVQSWLQSSGEAFAVDDNDAHADLTRVAAYLTLLTVIVRAKLLPSLQFLAPRPDSIHPVAVDLVLDVGDARTCGLLVEMAVSGRSLDQLQATLLELRDLTHPHMRQAGTFESRLEFARATFGDEALSRKSGRLHAFNWPSLARVGPEAVRLSRSEFADHDHSGNGASGMASPKHFIKDIEVRQAAWRFASDARGKRRQMVSGRILAHVTEAGLLPPPDRQGSASVLRPQFSRSAMMSFFVAEIVMQALSAINAPCVTGDRPSAGAGRVLRNIILSLPLTMPDDERDMVLARAQAGVIMLWRALGWDASAPLSPPLPTVRSGLDATLSAQIAFLYDEISERFAGDARGYTDATGKSRPEFGVQPCVRIAAIDIGAWYSHASTVTYAAKADVPIKPTVLRTQRTDVGGVQVRTALIADVLIPAIRADLAKAGIADPDALIEPIAAAVADADADDQAAAGRLAAHWLAPAAMSLLATFSDLSHCGSRAAFTVPLGQLVEPTGARMQSDSAFDAKANAAGADGFTLADVPVRFDYRSIESIIGRCLAPMLDEFAATIAADDCDIVLLSGWLGRLELVREHLLEWLPARPDRIVALHDRSWHKWYPLDADARALADGKEIGLIGTLLAIGEEQQHSNGDLRFAVGMFSGRSSSDDGMIESVRAHRLEIAGRRS